MPLEWARTRTTWARCLRFWGERQGGTARLEEAVVAFREALKENTRERVPLDWAKTEINLGNALQTLGEREAGTARLEEAVSIYREALTEEHSRSRATRLGEGPDRPRQHLTSFG